MKNIKKFFLIFVVFTLAVPIVWGHFPEVHVGTLLTALNDQSWTSDVKQKVLRNVDVCIAGLEAIDSTVIFYLTDEGRTKLYQGTHSIQWVNKCNQLAGNDEQKQVFCLCGGLHLVQDVTSHGYKNDEGYTSRCIGSYGSTNLFLHSICERAVVNSFLADLGSFNSAMTKDEIRLATCDAYDLLIIGDENIDASKDQCTNSYVNLLSESSDVDLCEAVHIVGANLKMMCTENEDSGTGYSKIYQSKIEPPTSWAGIAITLFIILSILLLVTIIFGSSGWKILAISLTIPLLIVSGFVVYYGVLNIQSFYHDYNFMVLDPLTKFIHVPEWKDSVQKTIDDTKLYFSDATYEIPLVASGFDFYENGKLVRGTLNKAETKGQIVFWAIGIIYLSFLGIAEWQCLKRRNVKRVL